MPIDKRRESRVIAVVFADVLGADDAARRERLRLGLERINHLFAPALPHAVEKLLDLGGDCAAPSPPARER